MPVFTRTFQIIGSIISVPVFATAMLGINYGSPFLTHFAEVINGSNTIVVVSQNALQAATSDIPIFFQVSSDPVGYGLVDSIARPGKNITGIAVAPQILWGKRLELLMELLGHRPAKIAWLSNPEYVPAKLNLAAVMQSAGTLGIKVERWEVRKADDLDRAFAAAAGSEAVLVQWLGLTHVLRWQIGAAPVALPL